LVLGLVGLDDVGKGSALDFREVDSVGDEVLDPVLVVLKGQI
jgi:hypothetical protein